MPLQAKIIAETPVAQVTLSGRIDEHCGDALASLNNMPGGTCEINLAGVASINSAGVRNWLKFVRGFAERRKLTLVDCSADFVLQMNMISSFRGGAAVRSVLCAFHCPSCNSSELHRLGMAQGQASAMQEMRAVRCSKCQTPCVTDEDPEDYLHFMTAM